MTIENQNIENKQVEEVKPKRKYKKRACALRKKTCEKYDAFLNLINLQGDYMMLQAHFIYLAVVMDYATVAQLQNDILPDMKRMGLVKTQYVGGTQAVMLVLKKTAIRHLKGLESSKNAFSVKETSSDFPKLLNIMKIDYGGHIPGWYQFHFFSNQPPFFFRHIEFDLHGSLSALHTFLLSFPF